MHLFRPLTARDWLLWMGPLTGLLVAWVWGDRTFAWLTVGTLVGYVAEFAALRVASRERAPGHAALAFFLAFATVLAGIPFLAVGGLLQLRASVLAGYQFSHLLIIPIAAGALAVAHHDRAKRAGGAPEDRRHDKPRGRSHRWIAIFGTIALVLGVSVGDSIVPAPYSIDFLYLIPVLVVTLAAGLRAGILIAIMSAESRGIVRGLSYDGDLLAGLAAFDFILIATGLIGAVLLVAHNQRAFERENSAARTDTLTGLMNRKAFLERLESEVSRAGRHQRPLSVAYIDLDGFKAVNDGFGHAAGDEVLRIVAGVLRTAIRGEDVPARLGGDEFAILLPETDPDLAPRVVERVRGEIEDRMHAFGWQVTCSVGLVTTTLAGTSVDTLLHRADQLMYEVKNDGKNALRQVYLDTG